MAKILALTNDGRITYCTASEENRGRGRCPHLAHQSTNESEEQFVTRANEELAKFNSDSNINVDTATMTAGTYASAYADAHADDTNAYATAFAKATNYTSTMDIDVNGDEDPAEQLDRIFGTTVTEENLPDLYAKATPEQIEAATRLGFAYSYQFSLPVESPRDIEEAKADNDLYFATLPKYGVCGKEVTMDQMFQGLGDIQGTSGNVNIAECYSKGLSPTSYFEKAYTTRHAAIAKTVTVEKPGYTSRLMFYSMSDIRVSDDCGGDHNHGAFGCKSKYICAKCAKETYGQSFNPGDNIGGFITTNMLEPGVQASMKQMQNGGGARAGESRAQWSVIENTFRNYANSPILQAAKNHPRHEAQQIIADGLAKAYADCGIGMDRFNIDMTAKHMCDERKDEHGRFVPCSDNEIPTFSTPNSRGKRKNLLIRSELEKSYSYLTTNFLEEDLDGKDAADYLMR